MLALTGFRHFLRQGPLMVIRRHHRARTPTVSRPIPLGLTVDTIRRERERDQALDGDRLTASHAFAIFSPIETRQRFIDMLELFLSSRYKAGRGFYIRRRARHIHFIRGRRFRLLALIPP